MDKFPDPASLLSRLPRARDGKIPILCVVGPTGAGKTALALALAKAHGQGRTTVVNADSRQIYADFPIVTAQPEAHETALCPHLLYGFLPTAEKLGAGEFVRLAQNAIAREHDQGRLCILAGGTGMYLKSLLRGIAAIPPVPPEIDAHWKARVKSEGSQKLHPLLAEIDPAYAARIHPNDPQRIARALAVHEATGRPFSWWHEQPLPDAPYSPLVLGLTKPLAELEARLKERISLMLERGAREEIERAWARCPDEKAPGWSGIGCRELLALHLGRLSPDEATALWLKNTRAYAKRQMTWFRALADVLWL